MTYNIRLAGVGGQGIITAGNIISEAAMRSGQKVIMSEIHGLSQRGGSVTVDVRIGDCYGPIISQSSCDLVIGLELIETFRAIESFENVGTALMSTEKINPISLSMHRKEYPSFEDLMEKYGMGTKIYPVEAGIEFASSYPGTPSSEVGETLSHVADKLGIKFLYSVNES